MTKKRLFLAAAGIIALAALGFVAIELWSPVPPGGLSQSDAIRIARSHADPGGTGVSSAEVRHNFQTGFDVPVHPWAWVVTFNGHWELLCSGSCASEREWVAIDYYSGEWIASQHSYPAPR